MPVFLSLFFFFFFNDPATTEIYTLSLHDALPISQPPFVSSRRTCSISVARSVMRPSNRPSRSSVRSEEHTSELQSHHDLVCRLLLEKKKNNHNTMPKLAHTVIICTTMSQPTNGSS